MVEKQASKLESKEFTISLSKAFEKGKPDSERAKNAVALVYDFFKKNYRKPKEQLKISNEVNQTIWQNSNNIPRKIQVQAIEKDGNITIYLKESKELKAEESKKEEKPKKPEEKNQAMHAKKEEKGEAVKQKEAAVKQEKQNERVKS